MKRLITGALALSLLGTVVSCKKEAKTETSVSSDTLTTVMSKDSTTAVAPKTDSVSSAKAGAENIITKNVGKYPHEIKIFEDKSIADRIKKLTGTQYDEMVKFFNVETPITSDNGVYKVTGCKQHDCPGYATTIYYDAKNDNLNVSIDKNGKITAFAEKGKITVSKTLDAK